MRMAGRRVKRNRRAVTRGSDVMLAERMRAMVAPAAPPCHDASERIVLHWRWEKEKGHAAVLNIKGKATSGDVKKDSLTRM
jgi:hypothetical protein